MSEHTLELWSTRKNKVDPFTFVGDFERLFYNPVTKSIRVSDGETPGGLPIAGGGSSAEAIYSTITPPATPNGLLWFNPDTDVLSVASNNLWVEVGSSSGSGAVTLYSTTEPAPSQDGLLWFNPDTNELSIVREGVWFPLSSGSGSSGFSGYSGYSGFSGYSGTATVVPYIFDGGTPYSTYFVGPAFDCGGVT